MDLTWVHGRVEFIFTLNLLHVFAFIVGFHTAPHTP